LSAGLTQLIRSLALMTLIKNLGRHTRSVLRRRRAARRQPPRARRRSARRFAGMGSRRRKPPPPAASRGRAGHPPPPPVAWEAPERRPCMETGHLQSTTVGRPFEIRCLSSISARGEHILEIPLFPSIRFASWPSP
jgi:hypothetical protein